MVGFPQVVPHSPTSMFCAWAALAAAVLIQGCTSTCKIHALEVESAREPNVILRVDVDEDLQSPRWKDHVIRLDYFLLDEQRLRSIRRVRPETPATIEEAGETLRADDQEHFSVVQRWNADPSTLKTPLEQDAWGGGIESGAQVQDGRWSYRIALPFRAFIADRPEDPKKADYARPDAYELKPGREYRLWARIFGVRYIGYRQLSSNWCTLILKVPSP